MAKDFSYYFSQLRKKEDHRSKQAEKDIRKLYKELLKDAKHFVAEEYYNLAQDGKLTYEILRANARDVRFLEEVEQKLTGVSQEVAESIRKAAEDVYRLAYDGMIDAVEKGVQGFSGLGGATDEMIKAAVNNPIATTALEKNYKDIVWDIKRQIATGLVVGDRYDTMAKRLSKALDIDYKKSVRIVRTETGRVREAGHLASAKDVNDALKNGTTDMRLTKTWKTMKDGSVRDTHSSMDGVLIAVDDLFELPSGVETTAPKQSGVASEDVNCRCYVSYKLMSDAEFYAATGKHFDGFEQKQNEDIVDYGGLKGNDPAIKSIEQELDRETLDWYESLTDSEKYGLERYTGAGYRRINEYLRTGVMPSGSSYTEDETKDMIANISRAIAKGRNEKARYVYRECGAGAFGTDDLSSIVGSVFKDDAFMSTSVFEPLGDLGDSVKMKILVPQNAKGTYIDRASKWRHDEHEFLLDKGTRLVFTGYSDGVLYAEVLV